MEEANAVRRVPQVEALLVDKLGRVFVPEVPLQSVLSISVIPGGSGRVDKDLSLDCALTQNPSPKVTGEVGAEPLLQGKSLDSQEGALSTAVSPQPPAHL